jgi:hypothetical protein
MSKKNNKKTKKNQHAFDLEREKVAAQKIAKKQQNKKTGNATVKEGKAKRRGIRIKKGVRVKVRDM